MKIVRYKRRVLVSKVLNLASSYEPVLEASFDVGVPQTGTRVEIPHYCDKHPATATFETHEQEILSTEIERETVRKGGWRSKEWTSKFLVVLVFGVSSDLTRIEFERNVMESDYTVGQEVKYKGRENTFESH